MCSLPASQVSTDSAAFKVTGKSFVQVPVEDLRRLFRYNIEDGRIYHLAGKNAGREAFTAYSEGYRRGRIGKVLSCAHLVAWAITYGYWPSEHGLCIDHINGDRSDNRIANLRAVSHLENRRNRHALSHGASGVVGVHPVGSKWQARIRVGGRHIILGSYETVKEATIARRAAEKALGFNHTKALDAGVA